MDHPLRSTSSKELRSRVAKFFKSGFSIERNSNIIFVCGGNDDSHMRRQFQQQFPDLLPEFEFFEPEFAMETYFSLGDGKPFNISEFETWLGELSHSIVIFPEGPGSFAELGYFSAIDKIAHKTLVAINSAKQKHDSFLSLGPAKIISESSIFGTNIQLDYKNPDFSLISNRLSERKKLAKNRKSLQLATFGKSSSYELFSLIFEIVRILQIATMDDIEYVLKSIFNGSIGSSKAKKITSMLAGSGRLKPVGDYGHLAPDLNARSFLRPRDNFVKEYDILNLDVSSALLAADDDFKQILENV